MKTEKPGVTTPTYPVFHVCDGIFIKQNSSRVKYLYADILYVEASRSYSDIHFKRGIKNHDSTSAISHKILFLH